MGLANYAAACRDHLYELKTSLSNDELRALAQDYGSLLSENWVKWVGEHEAEITSFVRSAPSARNAKRAWRDPVTKGRLTLAAIFHLLQAEIVLNTLSEMDLTPGGSYRGMAAHAGEAYNRIVFDREVPLWPFDEYLELVVPSS